MRACEQTEGVFYQGRMNNMYLAQMLTAAAKYGFPIIVSCYLLVREEEVNSKNPTNLTFNNRLVGFFYEYSYITTESCSQFLHFLKVPTLYHSLNFLKRAYFTGFPATLIFSSHSPLSKIKIFSFFESGQAVIYLGHFTTKEAL